MACRVKSVEINLVPLMMVISLTLAVTKLSGVADISWWAVTAPIWLPLSFIFVIFMIITMFVDTRGGR